MDEPFDIIGHGTHVIGSIAGSVQSGVGVAPGVSWMAAKGCRDGACLAYGLLKSAEWVVCPTRLDGAEPRCDLGADIVSNSWGSKHGKDDFYVDVVKVWREAGMIPVFAQGNQGPSCGTVNAPGDFVNVIAVGATDVDNRLARFSRYEDAFVPVCKDY
jgi:subtilisin family serine protease